MKYLNKYLYCVKTNKQYGIVCNSIYKAVDVIELNNSILIYIKTDTYEHISIIMLTKGVEFNNEYFLSPEKSLLKIRRLKYNSL